MDHVSNLTLDPVWTHAQLIDEDFLRAFSQELGVDVTELTTSVDGGRAEASMEWMFPADRAGIPAIALRFLPPHVHLTWAQSWGEIAGATARGTVNVRLHGRPSATAQGTTVLSAATVDGGPGTRLATSTATKADLPFPIAGQVETLIDRDLVGWILAVQARVLSRRGKAQAPA